MKQIELQRGERILAVVPQKCTGPGWSNFVAWVYIVNFCGELRAECLQQEDWSDDLFALAAVGEAMCDALKLAVPVTHSARRECEKPLSEDE